MKRYYVTQYGYVWSLSWENLLRFLRNGAEGKEWNLDHYGKPLQEQYHSLNLAKPNPARTRPQRFAFRYLVKPLDWTPEDFKAELKRVEAEGKDVT